MLLPYFIHQRQRKGFKCKRAYLHGTADAWFLLESLFPGIVIAFWVGILSTRLSAFIALMIVVSTWKLLRESIRLSLDGVPTNIDIEGIENDSVRAICGKVYMICIFGR